MRIVQAPAEVLATPAAAVERFGRPLRKLRVQLERGMFRRGVGLAAPQIGVPLRAFVYDDRAGHRGFVANPELVPLARDGHVTEREGCLSLHGWAHLPVRRWRAVLLRGQDERGEQLEVSARGLLARIFQHELDHLNGILYVERATGAAARAARAGTS